MPWLRLYFYKVWYSKAGQIKNCRVLLSKWFYLTQWMKEIHCKVSLYVLGDTHPWRRTTGSSILSAMGTRLRTELLIIEGLLSILNYINDRNIRNLINKVICVNPKLVVLMIIHCRIFWFITREIELSLKAIYYRGYGLVYMS